MEGIQGLYLARRQAVEIVAGLALLSDAFMHKSPHPKLWGEWQGGKRDNR